MRVFVGLVGLVTLGLLATSSSAADAKNTRTPVKREATRGATKEKKRAARIRATRERDHLELRGFARGQSVGAPWAGRLQHASELPAGDGYLIRRPERAYGTQATVELTLRAIRDTLDEFPDEHVLAIGDISARSGGTVTQHRSHQSGRDIDVGLFYLEQPAGYPASFIRASEANLDCAATFKLLENFLATGDEDGGVQAIFLDFDVQGILYRWALDHGVSAGRLARIFQYPHGRDSFQGLVHHEPNHDNHMHVRFQCPNGDASCR